MPHGSNGVSKIEESPATNSSAAVIDSLDEQPLDECRSALREVSGGITGRAARVREVSGSVVARFAS